MNYLLCFYNSSVRVKLINSRMFWQLMMISLSLILKKGTNTVYLMCMYNAGLFYFVDYPRLNLPLKII